MKTVTLKFVIDDRDEDNIKKDIQDALEQTSLGVYPCYTWETNESTAEEIAFKQEYDNRD